MTQEQWLGAAILGAIMFLLFVFGRHSSRQKYIMSRFAMMLLLDELAYRQQRIQFLRLIETLKVKSSFALLSAAMISLEDEAQKLMREKAIGPRMWQLNQRAIQTGESITDLLEKSGSPSTDLRGQELAPFTTSEKNARMVERIVKLYVALVRLKRRLRALLGI